MDLENIGPSTDERIFASFVPRTFWLLCIPLEHNDVRIPVLASGCGTVVGEMHSFQDLNGPATSIQAGFPDLIQRYHQLRLKLVAEKPGSGQTIYIPSAVAPDAVGLFDL